MLKEIILSFQAYSEAHQFIKKHRLWKWIFIPGILYCILFVFGFYYFWTSSNDATAWMLTKIGAKSWLDKMQDSWLSFFFIVGQVFTHLFLLIFYFSLFKFTFLVIGSPVFAYLSEKTDSIITGNEYHFDFTQLLQDMLRSIKIALRNFSWQTIYMLAFFIVSFIPLIGWITPLIAMFIDCFYMGFSMLDYSCERNKLSSSASIDLIGHHRGLAIGNGMVFYMFHAIPFLGWMLAPSYAVVAATLSMHKAKENKLISF
jgi:CysZ protein